MDDFRRRPKIIGMGAAGLIGLGWVAWLGVAIRVKIVAQGGSAID
ncbi:hypothetical protein GCM10008983_09480 [Lentibacillus halophilus]|uniref:Uncharacterized protein n=1 Tax=Lentibacillus halophilus TaxID=295065 RepID=A0ABN0Z722_9BACI